MGGLVAYESSGDEDETPTPVPVATAKAKVRREYLIFYPIQEGIMYGQRTALIRQRPDTGTNRGSQPEERWELR